jgi:spermidine synthase
MSKQPWREKYKVDVPEGEIGGWAVERFTITEEEARHHNAMASFRSSLRGSYVFPGDFTRLVRGRHTVVMSDTMQEIGGHLDPIREAKGCCLVNGLGLGVVANGMLMKPEVEHVTVIEKSPAVIKLVAQHYIDRYGDRIEIIEDDAFTFKPPKGVRYNVIWHDVWDAICATNLKGMEKLHRKYGRRCDWQDSWAKARARRLRG